MFPSSPRWQDLRSRTDQFARPDPLLSSSLAQYPRLGFFLHCVHIVHLILKNMLLDSFLATPNLLRRFVRGVPFCYDADQRENFGINSKPGNFESKAVISARSFCHSTKAGKDGWMTRTYATLSFFRVTSHSRGIHTMRFYAVVRGRVPGIYTQWLLHLLAKLFSLKGTMSRPGPTLS